MNNIKAVILAGGLGSRISEETGSKPKPMIEIGGMPILWHILKIYSKHGINDFIICCGYKGYVIKEFFSNYFLHMSDVTIDLANNRTEIVRKNAEPWKITLVETGEHTMTGGRIKRIRDYVKDDEFFCMTYGDGLSNTNITETINFHRSHGKLVTMTAVYPPGRFGALNIDENETVTSFIEKPRGDGGMINGGFFVISPTAINFIDCDDTSWENEPLENLSKKSQIKAYKHYGFWQPMDTLRDKRLLEDLWRSQSAPWKD